jgi:MFS family permease
VEIHFGQLLRKLIKTISMTSSVSRTNWNQVYALAALNAAVVISWIAYHNYQPKVLSLFHFEDLKVFLVIAQALILVFIPSLAGLIADSLIKRSGKSFVVFTVGIGVTAMVFMCVAFTVGTSSTLNLTEALPFMIVVWLISMNIFHSPANSMLELFAPTKELPAAMALMVVITDLLHAFENKVVDFVDWMGPVVTFAFGGVLLIVTGYFFNRTTRNIEWSREYNEVKNERSYFIKVLAAGLLLGLVVAVINNFIPEWLGKQQNEIIMDASWFVPLILVIAAIAAWPLSFFVTKIGAGKALAYGLVGSLLALGLAWILPSALITIIPICIVIGVFFSMASVSAFPFALSKLSVRRVTLGTGIFF